MEFISILKPEAVTTAPDHVEEEADNALATRGDPASFVLLYHRYGQPVYRYLQGRLHNHHDAKEITAIVFERAWQSLPRFKPSAAFAGWLFRIVQRALADHYRRSARRTTAVSFELASDPRQQPEERLLWAEQRDSLLRELARLSSAQQEIICLRFFAELPYATIAAIVGKREAAVKMTAYRALETLRRRIEHE